MVGLTRMEGDDTSFVNQRQVGDEHPAFGRRPVERAVSRYTRPQRRGSFLGPEVQESTGLEAAFPATVGHFTGCWSDVMTSEPTRPGGALVEADSHRHAPTTATVKSNLARYPEHIGSERPCRLRRPFNQPDLISSYLRAFFRPRPQDLGKARRLGSTWHGRE